MRPPVSPAKNHILLVEDDRDIQTLLKYNLEREGYAVALAGDGESAVSLFRRQKPRCVILDLMLPRVDGLEVCRLLRTDDRRVPILMLTAKNTEADKIVGLEMGADDYVTKPFSVREVLSRVKALLRRTAPDAAPASRTAGALAVDFEKYELLLAGKTVPLTPKEFELLKILWSANGKAVERDSLLERVWGYDRAADIDTRTVDQHVARLRAKLGREKRRVVTVKNVGYRFISE
ncbi:MAG TPA: response regulator transcription factor [Elusimicrobiota bacterium]|nr:response regulator transcription factor [Elusimicrobiota bacterium]